MRFKRVCNIHSTYHITKDSGHINTHLIDCIDLKIKNSLSPLNI